MAVRISGVVIPQEKRIVIALTYLHGIGYALARETLAKTKVDESTRTKDLTENESKLIGDYIKSHFKTEGDLRRDVQGNIKILKEIKCYRGIRHERRVPVRGQRTKTNQRTAKGNKRTTLGSGRVKLTKT